MLLDRSGNACFSGNVCALTLTTTDNINLSNDKGIFIKRADGTLGQAVFLGSGNELNIGFGVADVIRFATFLNNERLRITSTGIACFSCQVCAPSVLFNTVGTSTLVNTNITATTCFGATSRSGFTGLTDNCNGVYFGMGADGSGISAGIGFFRESSGWNSALAFYTNCITDGVTVPRIQEKMRITSCGNIGINFTTPSFPLTRSGMTMKAATNDGTEFVMLSCADTGFLGGALVRNGADFGVINRTNGNLIFATNAQERLYITGAGIACFACQICAPTIKAGSSTTLTSGNITLTGFPTSMCFGNGQTLNDNGSGGLTISSGAAIGLTAGSCIFMNCTVNFGKHQKHTDGYWYRIPFRVTKNTSSGVAGTFCIVSMASTDSFNEMFIYIDYASRLQGFSDQYTQVSSRMYGVNRFSSGTPTIGDTYIFAGGSGCSINNHAPITTNIVGSCGIVVKVDFSTTVSFSSFVWGEIRIFSIENLNSYLTIPYNEL
jgi:hypothetical protein